MSQTLQQLSRSGLDYGVALGLADAVVLAARLYGFNSVPLSPRLVSRLPGQRALREFLLKEGPAELTRHWRSQRHRSRLGWLTWIRRETPRTLPETTHKLYVSPTPDCVRDALHGLVPVITESRCIRFKVGATPADLARPDKLVAYFSDREELLRIAAEVLERLGGMPAQGVPFSAPIAPSRLISWGIDPPHNAERPISWRTWVCSEVALAMTACQTGDRFGAALSRLSALGIDPELWEPSVDALPRS